MLYTLDTLFGGVVFVGQLQLRDKHERLENYLSANAQSTLIQIRLVKEEEEVPETRSYSRSCCSTNAICCLKALASRLRPLYRMEPVNSPTGTLPVKALIKDV